MQEKGIQTTPGCTTVEHNGEVHEFIAHLRKVVIYELHQMCHRSCMIWIKKGRKSALTYHSGKLAIAFALVMPQHTPIRLEKNLCVRSIGRGYITTRFPEKILKINLLLCIGRSCFQFPTESQVISQQTHISHTKC